MDLPSLTVPKGYSIKKRLSREELHRLSEVLIRAPFVRKVLNTMPEMVGIFTLTRELVLANEAMLVFLGLKEGELLPGPRPGELMNCAHAWESEHGCGNSKYCTQCGAFQTIMGSLTNKKKTEGECRITREKDGIADSLELYIWSAPFEVDSEDFVIVAGLDMSDKKRRRALERIFFHDLLNTMNQIYGYVSLMDGAEPGCLKDLTAGLQKSAEELLGEILSQRDILSAENNELKINPSLVHARELLDRYVESYNRKWNCLNRKVEVSKQCANVAFFTDAVLLGRVLSNMIKNALEASGKGDTVTVGVEKNQERLDFWVHNPGVIPGDVQLQIFQRSFSTKGEDRGLGTYSMRLLAERYLEGRVFFSSDRENGTVFRASFPKRPKFAEELF